MQRNKKTQNKRSAAVKTRTKRSFARKTQSPQKGKIFPVKKALHLLDILMLIDTVN